MKKQNLTEEIYRMRKLMNFDSKKFNENTTSLDRLFEQKIISDELKMRKLITEEEKKESELLSFEFNTSRNDFSNPKLKIIERNLKQNNPHTFTIRGFVSFPNTKTSSGAMNGDAQMELIVKQIKDQLNEYKKDYFYKGIVLGEPKATIANFYGTASNSYGTKDGKDIPVTPEKAFNKFWQSATNGKFFEPSLSGDYKTADAKYKSGQQNIAKNRVETIKKLIGNVISLDGAKINTNSYIMDTGGKVDENRDVEKYIVPGQSAFFGMGVEFPKLKKIEAAEGMKNARELFSQTKTHRDGGSSEADTKEYFETHKDDNGVCRLLTNNRSFGLTKTSEIAKEFGLEPFEADIIKKGGGKYTFQIKGGGDLTRQQWLYVMYYLENQERHRKCKARSLVTLPAKVTDSLTKKEFDSEELKTIDFTKITFPIGAVNDKYEFVHDKARHKNV